MKHREKKEDFLKATGIILLMLGIIYFILHYTLEGSELITPISLFIAGLAVFLVGVFKKKA